MAGKVVKGGSRRSLNRSRRRPTWSHQPLSLAPPSRGTLGDRAADAIRRRIVLGTVRAGQRLEPMREMARQLGVSLGVVREGVAQLKAEGLLEVRHGQGTFVARRPRAARVLRATRRRAARHELEELRAVVEPALAAAAARPGTAHKARRQRDMDDLRLAVSERWRATATNDALRYTEADLEVHAAVARLSGNQLGAAACRMAGVALMPDLVARARVLAGDERLERLHDDLVEAIENQRPLKARRAATLIAALESGGRSPPDPR